MNIFKKKFNKRPLLKQNVIIHFERITIKNNVSDLHLTDSDFIKIVYKRKPYWAIFKCPCGCENVISLSLQKIHNPHWRVINSHNKRPTIYPSIVQNIGCLSHFWIQDGKIIWCGNSGIKPFADSQKW